MRLTIITVTYNNSEGLARTIKSITSQTCKDFEYVIVDGASTDNSVEIIKDNETHISKWISEPDTGIYNAMNKAVRMATGDYCLFINAGDELYSNKTVEEICKLDFDEDFVEGREYDASLNAYSTPPKEPTLAFYLFIGNNRHQASLIKRAMLLQYPYDEKLKIASDLKFNVESLVIRNCSYKCIDTIIAKYEGGGISRKMNHKKELDYIYSNLVPNRILKDYDRLSFMYYFPSEKMYFALSLMNKIWFKFKFAFNLIK